MGIKIKKEGKPDLRNLPALKIKYSMAVPFMGIVDILTMAGFYINPATDGNLLLKSFFLVCALAGAGFTYWGLMWKMVMNGNKIRVCPAFGAAREMAFTEILKVELHKKRKTGSLVFYEIFDKKGESFVKIYPLMKDSSVLLERFKRLGTKMEEISDR